MDVRMGSLFDENGLRRSARILVKMEEKCPCSDFQCGECGEQSEAVGEDENRASVWRGTLFS